MRRSQKGRLLESLGGALLVFALLGTPLADSAGVTTNAATAEPVTVGPTSGGGSPSVEVSAADTAPEVSSSLYPDDNDWHGGRGVPGDFTFDVADGVDVDHYLYGFQDPPSSRVDAEGATGSATVRLAPPATGPVDLYVASVDSSSNRSPVKVHHFYVRSGDGPLSHWKLDGDVTDSVPTGGRDGTVRGELSWVPGAVGKAVRLDGGGGHVTAPNTVPTDEGFAVSAWLRPSGDSEAERTAVTQDGEQASGFELGQNAAGEWRFALSGSGYGENDAGSLTSESSAVVGEWTHVTGVYDETAGQLRLYVYGSLVASEPYTGDVVSSGRMVIGRAETAGSPGGYWTGSIDEVRVHDRALAEPGVRNQVRSDDVRTAHWGFDGNGASETVPNLVPGGDPLAVGGTPERTEGMKGSALLLDGVDDRAAASGEPVREERSYSVAAWVRLDERRAEPVTVVSQNTTREAVFELGYSGSDRDSWDWTLRGPQHATAQPSVTVSSERAPQVGVWTHLVGVHDLRSGELRLFVNGRLAGTAGFDGAWDAESVDFEVGRAKRNGSWTAHFPGAVDELTTYDRAVWSEEAAQLAGRPQDLVHNLRLNESEGTVAEDWAGERQGTLHGDAAFGAGRAGNAVSLDGAGDHVSTSGVDLRTDESFTVSAWVYLSEKKDGMLTAVSVDGARSSKFRLGHVRDRDNLFGAWVFEMPESDTDGAPVTKAAVSTGETEVNTWTHLTGVYDASADRIRLYVNGRRINDGTVNNTWNAEGGLRIGRGKNAGAPAGYWSGRVDDVRLYSSGLTEERVAALHESYGTN